MVEKKKWKEKKERGVSREGGEGGGGGGGGGGVEREGMLSEAQVKSNLSGMCRKP